MPAMQHTEAHGIARRVQLTHMETAIWADHKCCITHVMHSLVTVPIAHLTCAEPPVEGASSAPGAARTGRSSPLPPSEPPAADVAVTGLTCRRESMGGALLTQQSPVAALEQAQELERALTVGLGPCHPLRHYLARHAMWQDGSSPV